MTVTLAREAQFIAAGPERAVELGFLTCHFHLFPSKCLSNLAHLPRVERECLTKYSIDISISGYAAFYPITRKVDNVRQQRLNVLQVPNPFDPKYDEVVPTITVAIAQMSIHSPKEIASQTNVVELRLPIENIDSGVAFH